MHGVNAFNTDEESKMPASPKKRPKAVCLHIESVAHDQASAIIWAGDRGAKTLAPAIGLQRSAASQLP
jgi:hypothetical protein